MLTPSRANIETDGDLQIAFDALQTHDERMMHGLPAQLLDEFAQTLDRVMQIA
jgi:hypothetical protein